MNTIMLFYLMFTIIDNIITLEIFKYLNRIFDNLIFIYVFS
jgi:hypothetical protein